MGDDEQDHRLRHAALAGPRAATVYAAILLGVALGLLAWRGGDLWTLPGKSPAEIAATRLPAHSTLLVWLDLVFALVVAAVLMVLAGWLYRSNWSTGWHLRREIALLVVTVVAALGYLVSEAIENGTMFKVVGDRTASDGQALALARAENGKWACLLVAVLGIVALFPRRPSARRSANSAP